MRVCGVCVWGGGGGEGQRLAAIAPHNTKPPTISRTFTEF